MSALMKRLRGAAVALATATLVATTGAFTAHADVSGDVGSHDPTLARSGNCYYVFATGGGINIRRSCAGLNGPWSFVGHIFPNGLPGWIAPAIGTNPGGLWAPDVTNVGGTWYAYYAASSFGSQNSVIGLATATNIEGPWTDRGLVIRSRNGDNFNAIDPDVHFTYVNGAPTTRWLTYGSFWSGIKARQLGSDGKLTSANTTTYNLISRPNNSGAVEAPSVTFRNGYYYMFASYDYCCRGSDSTYRIVYGRSTSPTGPFLDRAGVNMVNGGGTHLLSGYGNIRGPGHQDVLNDGGTYRLVHHYYDSTRNGASFMQIRDLSWTADGWPQLLGPSRQLGQAGVTIRNRHSNLCLDDYNFATNPGAEVRQWTCVSGNQQQWWVSSPGTSNAGWSTITNRHSNLCLDDYNGVTAPGAEVRQWTCNRAAMQDWQLRDAGAGYVTIVNRHNGLCLDNTNAATAPGSPVRLWTCNGHAAQQWRVA